MSNAQYKVLMIALAIAIVALPIVALATFGLAVALGTMVFEGFFLTLGFVAVIMN